MGQVDSTRADFRCQQKVGNKLGYRFDPVPTIVTHMVNSGLLISIDGRVINELVRFRRSLGRSCWSSKAVLAGKLGVSTRTIQSSFKRLREQGLIKHERVPSPEPSEPANMTGWRIHFLWIGDEQPISPPWEKSGAPRPGKKISPKELDGINPDGMKSSSSPTPPPSADDDDQAPPMESQAEAFQETIQAAERDFPKTEVAYLAAEIEADAPRIGPKIRQNWPAMTAAIALAASQREKPRKPFAWILATAKDFASNGISYAATKALAARKASEVARVVYQQKLQVVESVEPDDIEELRERALDLRNPLGRMAAARLKAIESAGKLPST